MRVTLSLLLILTLVGAYTLGRRGGLGAGTAESASESGRESESDLSSMTSFRASLQQPDALERSYRFHGFLQTLSPDEVAEAREIIEARNPWLVEDELLSFMLAWTRFDAPAAFEWALSRSSPFREQASAAALEAWAFHDPVAAGRALESVDRAVDRASLKEFLVAGWLKGGHHDGVTEYIMGQPPGTGRQRYTNLLTIELMRDGADAVVRWAEAIPDDAPGSYKTMAFQKAANILTTVDPVRAAGWIEAHLRHDYAAEAPAVIGRRWLEIDPPAALAWLASLPQGDVSDRALQSTLRVWLHEAPEDAEAWVRAASEAGGGRSAIDVMIARHAEDPPTAIGWAQRISDPADRSRTVVRLARAWHRREPEASKRWIEASELPPQMQNAILNSPSARRRSGGLGVPEEDSAHPAPAS
jgi:hypothetical protein